jgi:hypothetical protein
MLKVSVPLVELELRSESINTEPSPLPSLVSHTMVPLEEVEALKDTGDGRGRSWRSRKESRILSNIQSMDWTWGTLVTPK